MKKLGIFSLALMVGLLVAVNTGSAATWTVCASGCSSTTISGAILLAAPAGDTIIVKPGMYTESVLVDKSVRILGGALGTGKLMTFALAPVASAYVFTMLAPFVVISGFTISGGPDADGVVMMGPKGILRNCTVEKSKRGVVIHPPGTDAVVAYNQIRYNTAMSGTPYAGTGVLVEGSGTKISGVSIRYNQFNDNDLPAIKVVGDPAALDVDGMRISYNTLVNNESTDLTGPSNWNLYGVVFMNAIGGIKMSYNMIKVTSVPGQELVVVGPGIPTFTGTGNLKFPNNRQRLVGPSTSWTLP